MTQRGTSGSDPYDFAEGLAEALDRGFVTVDGDYIQITPSGQEYARTLSDNEVAQGVLFFSTLAAARVERRG